ncbi:MAG TPA: methyl-accepting chemotaxis protein [Thermoanaerobaculia bacterium]|nr:methyl-accepting chemotaxis protein [Thermoanaerobaculia bacterium]
MSSRDLRRLAPVAGPLFLALATLILLLVAEARGAAGWRALAGLLLAGAVTALALPPLAGLARGRELARTVRARLIGSLDHLAAGDLVAAKRVARQLPDEVASPFTMALASLEVLAERIQRSSVEVAAAAGSVQRISSELAAGSSEQSASVVEITAAMEELAQTASQIAGNAEAQADLARRGESIGDEGGAAVERAVAGVERLRERIEAIARRSADLERRAEEIFGVLGLVEEIARETHLLSLNAAIEAAGESGEVGQRFGEVAEEVRRLAARSHESAASVRRLLEEFSDSIRATVTATRDGGRLAGQVLTRIRSTSSAIVELRGALGETAAAAREISHGTGEQKTASTQVVQTLRESSSVVQQIAESLRGFAVTARELEAAAVDVQLLSQGFRLDSPSSLRHLAESWSLELKPLLASREALERRLENLLGERGDAECAYVYDPHRSRVAIVAHRAVVGDVEIPEEIRTGRGFADRPWYRAAVAERRAIVTAPFVSLLSQQRVVTAATPVLLDGEIAAVLGVDINLERWTSS